jgi:tetratricopeptide (TPR) repeat protein
MSNELDVVERAVLTFVEKGQGRWGWHELEVRLGSIDLPRRDYQVLAILQSLEQRGLVERVPEHASRWRILPAGTERLHGAAAKPATAAAPAAATSTNAPPPSAAPPASSEVDLAALVAALRGSPGELIARFPELLADSPRFAATLRSLLATRPDAADAVAYGTLLLGAKERTELARELWTSPRLDVRRALFTALRPVRMELQGRGTPSFAPDAWHELLRAGLDDADAEIRQAAAALVFSSATGATFSAELLRNFDRDPDARWTILLALGSATDADSLARLRSVAAGDDVKLAAAAVRALAARPDGAADAVAAVLGSNADVRSAALFALGSVLENLSDIQLATLDRAAAKVPLLGQALAAYRAAAKRAGERLPARSVAEEHLYLDLHPHACGQAGATGLAHELRFEGDHRLSRFVGSCPRCGGARDLTFVLPGDEPPGGAFGGELPSRLLDAGEFLAASDGWARQVAADPAALDAAERARGRQSLERAIHALDEVLKFIPQSGDEVPPAALRSEASQGIALREPGRFRRPRLEARREAYRELLAAYSASR